MPVLEFQDNDNADQTNEEGTAPDILSKYLNGNDDLLDKEDGSNQNVTSCSVNGESSTKRLRTFSETLKMLDDDIIVDLNVK